MRSSPLLVAADRLNTLSVPVFASIRPVALLVTVMKLEAPRVAAPPPAFSMVPLLINEMVVAFPKKLATPAENSISPLLV